MSSVSGHAVERPERSRNAKAQARHRAKRKAYIEQLEQTVTKLQTALGFTPDQVAALPPPLAKIRELEQDNNRLQKENDDLRRMLSDAGRVLPLEVTRRNSLTSFHDTRVCDRDFKRRKMSENGSELYMNGNDNNSHPDILSRPPPLTIPQPTPVSHHYVPSHTSSHGTTGSSLFGLHGPPFQMPNTPSGSSATSSPPFSPAQMQPPSTSPINHRPTLSNHPHSMASYSQGANHYGGPVKVEDENYASSNHQHPSNSTHYSLPPFDHGMDSWQNYSSERAALHR